MPSDMTISQQTGYLPPTGSQPWATDPAAKSKCSQIPFAIRLIFSRRILMALPDYCEPLPMDSVPGARR
jgi:hypothetical protein